MFGARIGYRLILGGNYCSTIAFAAAIVLPLLTSETPIRISPAAINTVVVKGSSRKYHPNNKAITGFI